MLTNNEILQKAMRQPSFDMNCAVEDFVRTENVFVRSVSNEKTCRYLELPFVCDIVSYGSNVVVSVRAVGFAYLFSREIPSMNAKRLSAVTTVKPYAIAQDAICRYASFFAAGIPRLLIRQ